MQQLKDLVASQNASAKSRYIKISQGKLEIKRSNSKDQIVKVNRGQLVALAATST